MNEATSKDKDNNSEKLANARLGYQTAVQLFALASQEFYSRFAAMLIVHGLLLTVIFRYPQEVSRFVAILATFVGISLCILWLFLIKQSLVCQDYYSKRAKEFEDTHPDTLRIFSDKIDSNLELVSIIANNSKGLKKISTKKLRIEISSGIFIVIFVIVYSVMLARILNNCV